MVLLYWSICRAILARRGAEGWETRVIDRLAHDFQAEFPGVEGFSPRSLKYMRPLAAAWPDETYIKIRGHWVYLYRAVDKAGQTIDFRLSRTRDAAAAKAFFRRAIRHEGRPHTITLDGYAASHRAVRELREDGLLPKRTKLRSSKYLNNLIEQDHRGIKCRTRPMLGFKNFESAATTIAGVELLRRIHKEQFA